MNFSDEYSILYSH